jgi:hypothetical protein
MGRPHKQPHNIGQFQRLKVASSTAIHRTSPLIRAGQLAQQKAACKQAAFTPWKNPDADQRE